MIEIKGLKKCSGYTTPLSQRQARYCIMYNLETHEVWADYVYGDNTWLEYHDKNIIHCGGGKRHFTMKEIREAVENAVEWRKRCEMEG